MSFYYILAMYHTYSHAKIQEDSLKNNREDRILVKKLRVPKISISKMADNMKKEQKKKKKKFNRVFGLKHSLKLNK